MRQLKQFLIGFGQAFDIFGTYPIYTPMTDEEAMASDWQAVMKDFNEVIKKKLECEA